jgi:hypothetical protein
MRVPAAPERRVIPCGSEPAVPAGIGGSRRREGRSDPSGPVRGSGLAGVRPLRRRFPRPRLQVSQPGRAVPLVAGGLAEARAGALDSSPGGRPAPCSRALRPTEASGLGTALAGRGPGRRGTDPRESHVRMRPCTRSSPSYPPPGQPQGYRSDRAVCAG